VLGSVAGGGDDPAMARELTAKRRTENESEFRVWRGAAQRRMTKATERPGCEHEIDQPRSVTTP
jgi:hypothetical protein